MKYITNDFIRLFQYTNNEAEILDVEPPGVDPKDVKLSHGNGRIYLNDREIVSGYNANFYDLEAIKAELKHGLLKITVPRKKPARTEIPLSIG